MSTFDRLKSRMRRSPASNSPRDRYVTLLRQTFILKFVFFDLCVETLLIGIFLRLQGHCMQHRYIFEIHKVTYIFPAVYWALRGTSAASSCIPVSCAGRCFPAPKPLTTTLTSLNIWNSCIPEDLLLLQLLRSRTIKVSIVTLTLLPTPRQQVT